MASGGDEEEKGEVVPFKHFDIECGESAVSDHHFVKEKTPSCFNKPTSCASKAIAKEWKILEENLPESIYVRAYEHRFDLLRAVIIGALGTPYHDCLFFFDIVFPPKYPSEPPKLYYHAHGHRLNPNLYENGMVCMSLIHTWEGHGVELWDPNRSTILQVLVSIQGLVLNSRPYFNEPGHDSLQLFPHYTKLSLDYNEEAFLMSCKTLLHVLRKPPNAFRNLVIEHCRRRGPYLLAAINSYSNGCSVIGEEDATSLSSGSGSSSSSDKISAQYKSSLEKTHKNLADAFKQYQLMLPLHIIKPPQKLEDVKPCSKGGEAGVVTRKRKLTQVHKLLEDSNANAIAIAKPSKGKRKTEVEMLLEDAKNFKGKDTAGKRKTRSN